MVPSLEFGAPRQEVIKFGKNDKAFIDACTQSE